MRASIVIGCCVFAASANAQTSEAPAQTPPTLGWFSFGLGLGSVSGDQVSSADLELSLSRGPLLVAARHSSLLPTSEFVTSLDPQTHSAGSSSLLFGVRAPNPAAFGTAAIGPGVTVRDERVFTCDSCAVTQRVTTSYGLALEGGVHATLGLAGLGARVYAFIGPGAASHATFALSVDVGVFRD